MVFTVLPNMSPGPPPGRLRFCSFPYSIDVVVALCFDPDLSLPLGCEHRSFVQQVLMERQAPTDARHGDVVVKGRGSVGLGSLMHGTAVLTSASGVTLYPAESTALGV